MQAVQVTFVLRLGFYSFYLFFVFVSLHVKPINMENYCDRVLFSQKVKITTGKMLRETVAVEVEDIDEQTPVYRNIK